MERPPGYARRVVALAAIGLLLIPLLGAQQSPPGRRPRLVVVIVVDQMRGDYVERFRDQWRGGLRRLVDQGAWFHNAAYPYAGTETCPGHATVSTGVFPATHGIIANAWWDRQQAKPVSCTLDAAAHDMGANRTASSGDSPARLLVPTFAEQLRVARPGSRVVTLSLKARSAIMLAGHRADVVLWLDDTRGDWLTSSAYVSAMPAFARDFLLSNPVAADLSKIWEPALPEARYKNGRSIAGESPPSGWTTRFPHALAAGKGSADVAFLNRWRASPFSDAYLGRLAAAAVHSMKLGHGPGTDFLGVSFSATDYVGHAFGPDSREVEDLLFRLDQTIGKLLDELDRAVGAGNYVVALAADHGVAPIPEQARGQGRNAGRVDAGSIVARVEKVAGQRLGQGRYVTQMVERDLYFQPGVMDRIHADPVLWREIKASILAEPGVERVFQSKELGQRSDADRLEHATALSVFPGRSGDLMIVLKPYWVFSSRTKTGWAGGTDHGSAHAYDQRVPLVLFGADVKPGRYTSVSSPADIAPTLASLCGIPLARTEGRVLAEAMQAPRQAAAWSSELAGSRFHADSGSRRVLDYTQ